MATLSDALPPHSSDPAEELSRVILALETAFSARGSTAADAAAANMADRYLVSFQRQAIAWVVCDAILATPQFHRSSSASVAAVSDLTPECHFFAAQTLRSKCRNYYAVKGQLPSNSLTALRDSLMQQLFLRHVTSAGGPIHNQLAMAISALAIQMGWRDVIPYLLAQVHSQDSSVTGAADLQLQLAHREAKIRMVLDLLRFLPEECNGDRLLLERDEEERHWFFNHVLLQGDDDPSLQRLGEDSKTSDGRNVHRQAKNAQHVLEFLWYLVQSYSTPVQRKIVHKVLECLHSWIFHVPMPAEILQQTPLLPWIVSLLQAVASSDNLFTTDSERMELAVDVIVEILRCYTSDLYWNKTLVQTLYPLLLSLGVTMNSQTPNTATPFQMALKRQDEDELRAFTRIFTEMGESYISLIVGPEQCQQVALVELILTCSSIPDSDISSITLNFWYRFVASLEEIEPYEYRQIQIDHFTPQLIKLVTTCAALIQYPEDMDSLSRDRIDEIHKDRSYMIETLEDCCRLLGQDLVLQSLGTRLRQECEQVSTIPSQKLTAHWYSIEASLFSLQSTSRYTDMEERTVLPFVFSIIPNLPVAFYHLRNTACLIVGKYAIWLGRHSEYLQPILPFLASGLSIPQSAAASANAIKILCESCSSSLSLGDSVLDLYDEIVTATNQSHQPILGLHDELLVLEGACKAISMQMSDGSHGDDSERITMYIRRLVEPIGTRLANTTFVGQGSTSPKLALNEIERLTVVARFLHLPRPKSPSSTAQSISSRSEFLLQLMTQCWPWLDSLSQKYPTDFNIAEKICRLHKHVLRGCGSSGYRDMIQPLCTSIVRGFAQSHLSPYLYLASICVTEYGPDTRYTPLLFEMIRELADKTFSILQSPQDLVAQPDLVEEFFFLASRIMTICPVPLLLSPLLEAMIKFSIICMKLDHKDANRGTLSFVESLVGLGIDLRHGQTNFTSDAQQMSSCREALESCFQREGRYIVENLIQSLMGNLPCYRIDLQHGSVGGILYKLNQLCPTLLYDWVTVSVQAAPEHAKRNLLRSFTNQGSNIPSDEFMSSIRWFSNYCIRETKLRAGE